MSVLETSFNLLVVKHHLYSNSLNLPWVWVGNGKAYPCFSWLLALNKWNTPKTTVFYQAKKKKGKKKLKSHAIKRALFILRNEIKKKKQNRTNRKPFLNLPESLLNSDKQNPAVKVGVLSHAVPFSWKFFTSAFSMCCAFFPIRPWGITRKLYQWWQAPGEGSEEMNTNEVLEELFRRAVRKRKS